MPTPQRLPIVNSDDGVWGDILRQYLMKEHYDDGTDNAVNGGHKTITIRAGTSGAGTAPLKFTSGTLMTTPEAGAIEFNSDTLYFTQTTSTTRKKIAAYDDTSGATGDIYYRDSSGYFKRLGIGSTNDVLTVSGGLPVWQAPSGSAMPVADTTAIVKNNADNTKQVKLDASAITTGTTRTLTVPNANTTIVGTDTTQTLTNKTLTSPRLSGDILDTNGNTLISNQAWSSSAVNYLGVETSPSGSQYVQLLAMGSDANIDLALKPKGTGSLALYVGTNSTATVLANGTSTDVNLDLTTKGAGVVKANGKPVITSVTGIPAVTGTPSSSNYL